MRLKDKVAIITGGAGGLGRAFAKAFTQEGAKLVVADVDMKGAEATVAEVKNNGAEALAVCVDVSSPESTVEMAEHAFKSFGRIDILLNNAGIMGRFTPSRMGFFWELDPANWDTIMAVNLKGPFLCSKAIFPYMKNQGGGKIINVSSATFFKGSQRFAHYVASKGGVIGLTRVMARDAGDYNINVNCIAPGSVSTDDPADKIASEFRNRIVSQRCFKRLQFPEDMTGIAVFLASSDADFITGQTIVVDGGSVMI